MSADQPTGEVAEEPPPHHAAVGRLAGLPEADSEWRRLSARMLLIHPVREVGRFIPALLGLFVAGRSTDQGQWWSVAGLVVVVALSIMRWVTTRYRITPEQLQLRKGLFHRTSLATPADRVRTVDVTANLMHRLLGLAKVEIGTASAVEHDRITLDALPAADAMRLRSELLHRVAPAPAPDRTPAPEQVSPAAGCAVPQVGGQDGAPVSQDGGAVPDLLLPQVAGQRTVSRGRPVAPAGSVPWDGAQEDEEVLLRLSPAWVRFAPFTLSGLVTGLAILGVGSRVLDDVGADDRWSMAQSAWGELAARTIWFAVLVVLVLILVAASVLAVGGYVLAFWGFRLSRHRRGTLQVSRGLVTTRATSIEVRRLRGVEVVEPLLLRLVGGARLLALTTGLRSRGGEGSNNNGALLAPPAPLEVIRGTGSTVLGDEEPLVMRLRSHGPAALRRRVIRALVPAVVLIAVLTALWALDLPVPGWTVSLSLVLLPLAVLVGRDRYRNLGHALSPRFLVRQEGAFVRRRAVLEREGIIGWNLEQTFFQRRSGLATLTATTAAGGQYYKVMDLPQAEAVAFADRAVPGLLADFLAP